jgi:hypothetical protein
MAASKRGKLDGLTNIEAAVERLRNLNWQYRFKEDSASGAVTDFIFTPPEGLQLWQRFPSVIFMDCTYKTNKVRSRPHRYLCATVLSGLLSTSRRW